jgi:hypothetical protein
MTTEIKKNLHKLEYIICTFPALILKLYTLQELYHIRAGKRVLFHTKFSKNNIYFFSITCLTIEYCSNLCIFYLLLTPPPLIFNIVQITTNYEKIIAGYSNSFHCSCSTGYHFIHHKGNNSY